MRRSAQQLLLDFFFQPRALFALLAKSRGDYHCRFHARVDTLSDDLRHSPRRRHHQRQIDSAGDVANMFLRLDSEHFAVAGIHGINFDGIFTFQKI